MNEAVVFGDGFEHATQLYPETDNLRAPLLIAYVLCVS